MIFDAPQPPTAARRADLLLVCSTRRTPAAARGAPRGVGAVHAHLGHVRQERRSFAPRAASASLRAWPDQPQHQEPAPESRRRVAGRRARRALGSCSRPARASPCRSRGSRGCAARRSSTSRASRGSTGPSLTYRLIAPIAARRYVQWPELARTSPRSAVRGQRLLGGRMIFVSVGTNEARFDRLLQAVAAASTRRGRGRPARPLRADRSSASPARRLPRFRGDGRSHRSRPGGRHTRGRRLGDGLARQRQAAGRRPSAQGVRRGGRRPPVPAGTPLRAGRAW